VQLGISSYTYNWAVGVPGFPQPAQPLTAESLIDKAAALGVRVVQIADNMPLDALDDEALDRLARHAAEQGITLEAGTAGVAPAHLVRYLEIAQRLNSKLLRTILDTSTRQPTIDAAEADIAAVLPRFEQADVTLAIENHDRFPAAVLAGLIDRLSNTHVGVCLDTANSLGCGEDLHTVLTVLGPWVVNLHIKDFVARRLPHRKGYIIEGCPAGQGLVHIPRVLDDLEGLARDPTVILELWQSPENTVEATIAKEEAWAAESVAYLRQLVPS
jgi:sugar phosphate isomerase/epimerase